MNAQCFSTPEKCPSCHRPITLDDDDILGESVFGETAEMAFRCPYDDCRKLFISYLRLKTDDATQVDNYLIETILPIKPSSVTIPSVVDDISPAFRQIYYESLIAKEYGLSQICGAGFRRALEFLIKDYAKGQTEHSEHKKISEMNLANVVGGYLKNEQIKTIVERAVWLGNDEVHYIRRWENKDVDDLLLLIELTLQWINIDYSSKNLAQEMPKAG